MLRGDKTCPSLDTLGSARVTRRHFEAMGRLSGAFFELVDRVRGVLERLAEFLEFVLRIHAGRVLKFIDDACGVFDVAGEFIKLAVGHVGILVRNPTD